MDKIFVPLYKEQTNQHCPVFNYEFLYCHIIKLSMVQTWELSKEVHHMYGDCRWYASQLILRMNISIFKFMFCQKCEMQILQEESHNSSFICSSHMKLDCWIMGSQSASMIFFLLAPFVWLEFEEWMIIWYIFIKNLQDIKY